MSSYKEFNHQLLENPDTQLDYVTSSDNNKVYPCLKTLKVNREFKKLKTMKKEREENHVSQAMLADILGFTPQYFSALERGCNELTYYDAYKIAKYLGTTPDNLFYSDAKQRHQEEIHLWQEQYHQVIEDKRNQTNREMERIFEESKKKRDIF